MWKAVLMNWIKRFLNQSDKSLEAKKAYKKEASKKETGSIYKPIDFKSFLLPLPFFFLSLGFMFLTSCEGGSKTVVSDHSLLNIENINTRLSGSRISSNNCRDNRYIEFRRKNTRTGGYTQGQYTTGMDSLLNSNSNNFYSTGETVSIFARFKSSASTCSNVISSNIIQFLCTNGVITSHSSAFIHIQCLSGTVIFNYKNERNQTDRADQSLISPAEIMLRRVQGTGTITFSRIIFSHPKPSFPVSNVPIYYPNMNQCMINTEWPCAWR